MAIFQEQSWARDLLLEKEKITWGHSGTSSWGRDPCMTSLSRRSSSLICVVENKKKLVTGDINNRKLEANIHQQMELSVLLFHIVSLQDCIYLPLVSKWDHGQTFQVPSISEFQALEEERKKKRKKKRQKEQKLIVASLKMQDKYGEGIEKTNLLVDHTRHESWPSTRQSRSRSKWSNLMRPWSLAISSLGAAR